MHDADTICDPFPVLYLVIPSQLLPFDQPRFTTVICFAQSAHRC